jgi:ubiquitin-protein ligase
MKLLVSDYDVHLVNENNMSEFIVKFFGPKESAYEEVSKIIKLKMGKAMKVVTHS